MTDLWTKPTFNSLYLGKIGCISPEDIETWFKEKYSSTYPVLFPSARSAISAILESHSINRNDQVWVPPYSSHCVLTTISKHGTPTTEYRPRKTKAILVYHALGYIHKSPGTAELIIEDSVDSLIEECGALFPNNGQYEVLSLPKLIGTIMGGIVLCRKRNDAESLKKIRCARHNLGWSQLFFRRYLPHGAFYWQFAELYNGFIPKPVLFSIQDALKKWLFLIENNLSKMNILAQTDIIQIKKSKGRVPCVALAPNNEAISTLIKKHHLFVGTRHFNTAQNYSLTNMDNFIPIPIHMNVDPKSITKLIAEV